MERSSQRYIPRWATKLGAAALVASALVTTSCASARKAPEQPPVSYAAPTGEAYVPDDPASCRLAAKEAGHNALKVVVRLGNESGVTGGTFTVVEDSIENGYAVAKKSGNITHDKGEVELADPRNAAASIDVTGWNHYGASDQRSFSCTTDFYPPAPYPAG